VIPITVCAGCDARFFPERLLCARCGSSEVTLGEVSGGVVEEATLLRRVPGAALLNAVPLGSVRFDGGHPIVVRLDQRAERGARVELELDGGAPVARLYRREST